MKDLAFYIQCIKAAIRAREPHRPRKRDQEDKGHASTGGVGSTKGRKVPSGATPSSESMFTRDRRPKKRTQGPPTPLGTAGTTDESADETESLGGTDSTAGD
jgi:hypothetical protein